MKRYLLLFGILFMCLGVNINAEYVDNETPVMEQYESDYIEDNTPKSRSTLTRGALTIPVEGKYDTIKDTHNAAGVMTARSFYYKSKLVEKRTYTQTGSTDCRMKNKYLYYSNGSTVYTHRTYSNTGATCYNLQTKTYNTASKIQAHLIYEGKINGKVKERRDYEATGTYYTAKSYYKNGIITSKEYWKGASGNYILEYGLFNAAGKNWTKLTRYYNSDKDISEIINYAGVEPNIRKNTTLYDINGNKTTYLTYDAKGDAFQKNLYDEDGYLTKEIRYYAGTGIWQWDVDYQEGNNKKDVVTYRDLSNKIIRQLRYFLDGTHLRWDINYIEGKPADVKIFNMEKDGTIKYIHQYNENDQQLLDIYNKKKSELGEIPKLGDLIESKGFAKGLAQQIDLALDDKVYIEDFKGLEKLKIDNKLQKEKADNAISENIEDENIDESSLDSSNELDFEENDTDDDGITEEEDIDVLDNIKGIRFIHNLEKIEITNTNLSMIDDEIEYLDKLLLVDFSKNSIHTISGNFKKLKEIEILNLSDNQIKNTSELFDEMTGLKEIDLSNNDLDFISNDLVSLSKYNLSRIKVSTDLLNIKDTDIDNLSQLLDTNILYDNNGVKNNIKSIFKVDVFSNEDEENLTQQKIIPDFSVKTAEYSKSVAGETSLEIHYNDKIEELQLGDTEELNRDYIEKIKTDTNTVTIKNMDVLKYNKSDFEKNGIYVVDIKIETRNSTLNQTVVIEKNYIPKDYNGEQPEKLSDLPVDIIEDIQSATHNDLKDKIISNQGDINMSIDKANGEIDINNTQQNDSDVKAVIDDQLTYTGSDDGIVKYDDSTKNYNVKAQVIDGGARYIFNIENEYAPKEYKINLDLPEDSKIIADGNGYKTVNSDDETVTLIGAPWAVDGSGNFIDTNYEIRENSIYQKINYNGKNYPLKADPLFCSNTINNTKTKWFPNGSYKRGGKKRKGIYRVYTNHCTKAYLTASWLHQLPSRSMLGKHLGRFAISSVAKDAWKEVANDASFKKTKVLKKNSGGIKDQFLCHAVNPTTIWKSPWNLEPGRPNVSIINTYKKVCNP